MTPTNGEMNRKSEKVRRANRTIQNRTLILMAFLGVGVFIALFFKLFSLQILRHDELEAKALDQQTRSTVVTATRGTIYDRNGNIMAISATAETVFLSPLEMNRALNDKDAPVTWTKDSVAQRLGDPTDQQGGHPQENGAHRFPVRGAENAHRGGCGRPNSQLHQR